MALFDFTKKILAEEEITVYNYGNMKRDFTYVEDILDGIECVIDNDVESGEIFNIGRGQPVQLMDFIEEIEKNTGKKAIKNLVPKHPADTLETWSNTSKLESLGYCPDTNISVGIKNFYEWYMEYHNGR
jgi:UDP-glucuronate 4-epimerase